MTRRPYPHVRPPDVFNRDIHGMKPSDRRSTTDKTGQHTRSKQVQQLLARDGAKCWLCETDIDMTLRFPNPGCATRDHVIPRKHRGSNHISNLRLAHKYCNEARGATITADVFNAYKDDGVDL